MVLFRQIFRRSKDQILQGTLDKQSFKNLPFKHNWNNLVKMYDMRMWYIANSPNEGKNLQYVHEAEQLHNELNYQNARQILFRYLLFLTAFYGFFEFYYEMPKSFDWQDKHEPKFQQTAYGELEEGGDEGDD